MNISLPQIGGLNGLETIRSDQWIGVDLDGTLAEYHGFINAVHIGLPIAGMVDRVRTLLRNGIQVKVFTSRANPKLYPDQTPVFLSSLTNWIRDYILRGEIWPEYLSITYEKDQGMALLWDDRAVTVETNTGEFKYHTKQAIQASPSTPSPRTVPEILEENATTYAERNDVYGYNYKTFGEVMTGLLPNGVKLNTKDDFARFALVCNCVGKIGRYCGAMEKHKGHIDSARDLSVYAAMLQEITNGL